LNISRESASQQIRLSADPTVSVVISHYNSARTIRECLTNLSRQVYPPSKYEIIVVDAGSNDGSIDIVNQLGLPNLRQIVSRSCTEPEGQNIGIGNSRGEILMFTNSDIYVASDWIRKHVDRLNSGYDLIGGRVIWGGDKFTFAWNMPRPNKPQYVQQQGMGLGFSNCSMRRDFLNSKGGLRNLKSQHDTEFAFRAIRTGGKMILDPEIVVYHDHPFKSLRSSFLRSLGYSLNHTIVMRSSYGRLVSGSDSPSLVTPSSVIKELFAINGILVFRELYSEASKRKINTNLLEFVVIRILGSKLGVLIGVIKGSMIRKASYSKIPDLHKQTEKLTKNSPIIINTGD
jgi:glycosyltransferase involved in cell wall biosynthesis